MPWYLWFIAAALRGLGLGIRWIFAWLFLFYSHAVSCEGTRDASGSCKSRGSRNRRVGSAPTTGTLKGVVCRRSDAGCHTIYVLCITIMIVQCKLYIHMSMYLTLYLPIVPVEQRWHHITVMISRVGAMQGHDSWQMGVEGNRNK
jgi:hypothetical protein